MRHILITNSKGGGGKSTLATNLAAYYASEGYNTVLADYDSQGSSLGWLKQRPEKYAPIVGIDGCNSGLRHAPRNADIIVIDAPARSYGRELGDLVRRSETILVPVLPSSMDINAADNFLQELLHVSRIAQKKARVALVANRVRENTLIFAELEECLEKLKAPYIATLREAQNYVRAYQRGLGIHELPPYLAWPDWEQWDPLIEWLDSRRSRPRAS